MTHIRRFSDCTDERAMAMYFIRKTPKAQLFHTRTLEERWLPKLGAVCVDIEGVTNGYSTRAAAIQAARKYHNMISEKLKLTPIYQ